jgi:hypothetical protein
MRARRLLGWPVGPLPAMVAALPLVALLRWPALLAALLPGLLASLLLRLLKLPLGPRLLDLGLTLEALLLPGLLLLHAGLGLNLLLSLMLEALLLAGL